MIVKDIIKMHRTEREIQCPKGGFTSIRMLIKKDDMGFTMTRTTVHKTEKWQMWHYKNHVEACYCIKGKAKLRKGKQGKVYNIKPGMFYAVDKHDLHYFKAEETTILICVFNPPLNGEEVHLPDGSYSLEGENE